jgi:hypothetical protein
MPKTRYYEVKLESRPDTLHVAVTRSGKAYDFFHVALGYGQGASPEAALRAAIQARGLGAFEISAWER